MFRSLFLVFMDNSTAEYTFLSTFFNVAPSIITTDTKHSSTPLLSPDRGVFSDARSSGASDYGGQRVTSSASTILGDLAGATRLKEEQMNYDSLWKQIFDPVLEYCKVNPTLL